MIEFSTVGLKWNLIREGYEKRGKKDQIEREVVFDVGLFNLWMVGLPEYIYIKERMREF